VEGSVEGGHHGDARQQGALGAQGVKGDRVVQRCELAQGVDLRQHGIVDERGLHEARPAMNDAVASRRDRPRLDAGLPQRRQRLLDRRVAIDDARRIRAPRRLRRGERFAAARGASVAADLEDARLERARAGVEDEDAAQYGHVQPAIAESSSPNSRA